MKIALSFQNSERKLFHEKKLFADEGTNNEQ
jgi:hypothetical protein